MHTALPWASTKVQSVKWMFGGCVSCAGGSCVCGAAPAIWLNLNPFQLLAMFPRAERIRCRHSRPMMSNTTPTTLPTTPPTITSVFTFGLVLVVGRGPSDDVDADPDADVDDVRVDIDDVDVDVGIDTIDVECNNIVEAAAEPYAARK